MKNPRRIFLIPSRDFPPDRVRIFNKKYIKFLDQRDIVIRFNRVTSTNKMILRNKTDFRFIRAGLGIATYKDGRLRGKSWSPPVKLVLVKEDWEKDNSVKIRKILRMNREIKKWSTVTRSEVNRVYNSYGIKMGKPSLGFYVIDQLIRKFPKAKIILVGFQFVGFKLHNFKKEKEIVLDLLKNKKLFLERL